MRRSRKSNTLVVAAALAAAVISGCGKDEPRGGTATQQLGQAASPGILDGVIGHATPSTGGDGTVAGIVVTASGPAGQSSFSTSPLGAFSFTNGPLGDVTVTFARGGCRAAIPLADVTNNAHLTLSDVTFDCASATAARIQETFQGVLRNQVTARVAVLQSCAAVATANHTRLVKTDTETLFEDGDGRSIDFSELAPGDVIEASGYRENVGAPSSIVAGSVQRLARGQTDLCASSGQ